MQCRPDETYIMIHYQALSYIQFSSLTVWVIRDNSAEVLFQSFLQEALVSSCGMGMDVFFDVVHPAFL